MGRSSDSMNTGSVVFTGNPGYDGFLVMFAIAWSTLPAAEPPGGVAASRSLEQLLACATQLATALLSELNVAGVDVSVLFGRLLMTSPSSPLNGLAKLTAIENALTMPTGFPEIFPLSMNCA